jgi:hypothetical protein
MGKLSIAQSQLSKPSRDVPDENIKIFLSADYNKSYTMMGSYSLDMWSMLRDR